MNAAELKAQEERLRRIAEANWGAFRKWIAANPLSGFWSGVAAGVLGGALLRGLF